MKLNLKNIKKIYNPQNEADSVTAVNGISLAFRKSEFVSILGPSGCGKTSLLNMIGGLDRYDEGDLQIDGKSTANFENSDWDAYRNQTIGFVFQNYHLIAHQNVLENVEIALTLSGVGPAERTKRAKAALKEVGLADKIKKKPNQLSGGQLQRVAIARALINNPSIILADEPTGALDSKTSLQIMELLKDIAKTRLVIMVTHNEALAYQYSTRIITLLDGQLKSDSHPLTEAEMVGTLSNVGGGFVKTAMSMNTAMSLSLKNLLTKKGRTVTTTIAASVGIVGLGLVFALTGGINNYLDTVQTDTLSNFPLMVPTTVPAHLATSPSGGRNFMEAGSESAPTSDRIYRFEAETTMESHTNILSPEFLSLVQGMPDSLPEAVSGISFDWSVGMNVLARQGETVVRFDTASQSDIDFPMPGMDGSHWHEMPASPDFIFSHYELLEGRLPEAKDEIILVVDQNQQVGDDFLANLGMPSGSSSFAMDDFLGSSRLRLIHNNDYYQQQGDLFAPATPAQYQDLFEQGNGLDLTVVGILRVAEDNSAMGLGSMFLFSEGFFHTAALTEYVLEQAAASDIAAAQLASDFDIFTGVPFEEEADREQALLRLGAVVNPVGINIFPSDFDGKGQINAYLAAFNSDLPEYAQIRHIDLAETMALGMMGSSFGVMSYALMGFAAIALLVSTLMIGIITYVSVMERTKEIGILRAVGARQKDISRVFTAETLLIGFAAGTLGIGVAYLLTIPVNMAFESLVGIGGIVSLNPIYASLLVGGSMLLTLLAGFFPARMAAKKNPVEALRTE